MGGLSSGNTSVGTSTSLATVAIEAKKELDDYRTSIVYASYQLGMGRIAYANNDLDGAKKYFDAAREASGVTIAGIANLGQTRRFRAAARTSLGDVSLRQNKLKEAKDYYTQAIKGAQDDKRDDGQLPVQPEQHAEAENGGHQAPHELHQTRAHKIPDPVGIAHDARDQDAGLRRVEVTNRQADDMRLDPLAHVGNRPLRSDAEDLRERK